MSLNIESHYLDPIVEVFGEVKNREAIVDELAKEAGSMSSEELARRAESLKRRHKGKTAPSLYHLRQGLRGEPPPTRSAVVGQVTKDTYFDHARSFMNRDGKLVTIDRDKDKQAWEAWQTYYRKIGMKGSAACMDYDRQWFVPTTMPHDFDLSA